MYGEGSSDNKRNFYKMQVSNVINIDNYFNPKLNAKIVCQEDIKKYTCYDKSYSIQFDLDVKTALVNGQRSTKIYMESRMPGVKRSYFVNIGNAERRQWLEKIYVGGSCKYEAMDSRNA